MPQASVVSCSRLSTVPRFPPPSRFSRAEALDARFEYSVEDLHQPILSGFGDSRMDVVNPMLLQEPREFGRGELWSIVRDEFSQIPTVAENYLKPLDDQMAVVSTHSGYLEA